MSASEAYEDYFGQLDDEPFEEDFDPSLVERGRGFRPPDDGTWTGLLKFQVKKDEEVTPQTAINRSEKNPEWWSKIQFVVDEGQQSGGRYAFSFAGTRNRRIGKATEKTNAYTLILNALGYEPQIKAAHQSGDLTRGFLASKFWEAIGEEGVRVVAETFWVAECRTCKESGVRNSKETPWRVEGQRAKRPDGTYYFALAGGVRSTHSTCVVCGGEIEARNAEFRVVSKI